MPINGRDIKFTSNYLILNATTTLNALTLNGKKAEDFLCAGCSWNCSSSCTNGCSTACTSTCGLSCTGGCHTGCTATCMQTCTTNCFTSSN